MSHLDDLAAALVDNELTHDQRDRALSHIARCADCRAAVEAQRRLKALLANQADPAVSVELTVRLLNVARDAAGPNTPDVVRAGPRPAVRPPGKARLVRRPRTLRRRAATFSALGVALVAGVVAAGGESDGPRVRPPVSTFVGEHTATTANLPLDDPAGAVVVNTSYGR